MNLCYTEKRVGYKLFSEGAFMKVVLFVLQLLLLQVSYAATLDYVATVNSITLKVSNSSSALSKAEYRRVGQSTRKPLNMVYNSTSKTYSATLTNLKSNKLYYFYIFFLDGSTLYKEIKTKMTTSVSTTPVPPVVSPTPLPPPPPPVVSGQRLTATNLEYAGAFRMPASTAGSDGPISLGGNNASLFVLNHVNRQQIGEITIPELVKTNQLNLLKSAADKQAFINVFNLPATGNPQSADRIGGLLYLNGKLIVNVYTYYDNDYTSNKLTTMIFNDASKLSQANQSSQTQVYGYHKLPAGRKASGWLSHIPQEWQTQLGGAQLTGFSSGIPIISNNVSVGPSAYAFNATNLTSTTSQSISTSTLLEYGFTDENINTSYMLGSVGESISKAMSIFDNVNLDNKLWTRGSFARHGVIIPGTSTYLVVGNNAGIYSGMSYGVPPYGGDKGYYPNRSNDLQNYYWLYDVNDFIKVKKGELKPYDLVPYAYGILDIPFGASNQSSFNPISGAAYDEVKSLLYISVRMPWSSTEYDRPPVVVVLKINK